MTTRSELVWMDGELVEFDKATVPFLNRTLHYGAGVFEGIRCYSTKRGPAVFRLRDHIERLYDSAHILSMRNVPFSVDEIIAATKQTISANGYEECYIRPLIYFSTNEMGLNLDQGKVSIGIAVWKWGAYLGEAAIEKGVRACVSNFTRQRIFNGDQAARGLPAFNRFKYEVKAWAGQRVGIWAEMLEHGSFRICTGFSLEGDQSCCHASVAYRNFLVDIIQPAFREWVPAVNDFLVGLLETMGDWPHFPFSDGAEVDFADGYHFGG